MNLGDARVWLTGASSGIGEALVPALLERGARLAITARRADVLERLAVAHRTGAHTPVVVPADVSSREAVGAACRTVEGELGGIDLAIFNAGIGRHVSALRPGRLVWGQTPK